MTAELQDRLMALESRITRLEGNTPINTSNSIDPNFITELVGLKGIGKETVADIVRVYPNKESLISDIKAKIKLPFRNNVEKLLIQTYMKGG